MQKVNVVTIEACQGGFIVYDEEGGRRVIGHDGSPLGEAEALASSINALIGLLGHNKNSGVKINVSVNK